MGGWLGGGHALQAAQQGWTAGMLNAWSAAAAFPTSPPGRCAQRLSSKVCRAACCHSSTWLSPPACMAATGKRPGWHDGIGEVAIHPSSICHMLELQQYQRPYVMYLEKVPPVSAARERSSQLCIALQQ